MADWEDVTVIKKRPANSSAARSSSAVNAALRSGGDVVTEKKSTAGNKHGSVEHQRISKLDRETEELSHQKVSMSVGRAIQQGRQQKGLTQKDVAVKINEKPSIVNDYEAGRAIPNQQILGKLERVLGVKLRGANIGQPLKN